jgi:flagellar motor switch/type III secretory pathway protein FliN
MSDARETDCSLRIELGRVWLAAEEAASLEVGSRIELDCAADEGVDVFAGARRLARGTPAVMDGMLCVRVSEVLAEGASRAAGRDGRAAR